MTALFMTSGLKGVLKMGGRRTLPVASPLRSKIFADVLPIVYPTYHCGDMRDICVIFGGASGVLFGGRAGYRSRIRRLAGPGRLPSMRRYVPLTGPYRKNPPFGVTSFPSVPIFRIRLLYSVLW